MTSITSYTNVSWENMTGFNDFILNANASGGNWLFSGIVFMIFMIVFITLTGAFGFESALLVSAFISFVLALLLNYAGLVSWYVVGFPVGLIIAVIMYIMWSNKYD